MYSATCHEWVNPRSTISCTSSQQRVWEVIRLQLAFAGVECPSYVAVTVCIS